MKIYLLSQSEGGDVEYDTYDACVVCAENEEDAKSITPFGSEFNELDPSSLWAQSKSSVSCKELGQANDNQKRGVVLASYNAS